MANAVFDTIRTLLAVREYQDKPVSDDLVRRVVESARLSASASNKQPWHFVVIRDRNTLREIGPMSQTGPYIAQANFAVAVAVEKGNPLAVSDASRAIQDMMLTAWEDGVGSNWVGFAGGRLGPIGKRLGIPDSYDVLAIVPFGYPRRQLGKGKKNRKPLGEVASAEKFGQPFK